jgi:hypothetical protein
MSQHTTLTLRVHVPGAESYPLGDEIWEVAIDEAIAQEADTIAADAGAELLAEPTEACREQLRQRVIEEMTAALVAAGDSYTGPGGVRYSLAAEPVDDHFDRRSS